MNYLTIDAEFCDPLRSIVETVELRDASGKILGHFTPSISAEEWGLYKKAKTLFILGTPEFDTTPPHPNPPPQGGRESFSLPPPLWGRVGVGGSEEVSQLPASIITRRR